MRRYFAYGSNMSRQRLQARTQRVVHHGHAVLDGYVHRFSHHGSDGTAKGNIERVSSGRVEGVVYELSHEQVELLDVYEGGYQMIEVQVRLSQGEALISAYSYTSIRLGFGLLPHSDYYGHYLQGMRENQFTEAYIEIIRKQAGEK